MNKSAWMIRKSRSARIQMSKIGALHRAALWFFPAIAVFSFACNSKPMNLSWQDTSENEDGFRIYRIANSEKKLIAEVGANVTHYTDPSAPRGSCYIVTAFNAAGESAATDSACRKN